MPVSDQIQLCEKLGHFPDDGEVARMGGRERRMSNEPRCYALEARIEALEAERRQRDEAVIERSTRRDNARLDGGSKMSLDSELLTALIEEIKSKQARVAGAVGEGRRRQVTDPLDRRERPARGWATRPFPSWWTRRWRLRRRSRTAPRSRRSSTQ